MYIVSAGLKTQCKDQSLVFEVSILTTRSVGFMPLNLLLLPFNFTEVLPEKDCQSGSLGLSRFFSSFSNSNEEL